jgi:hypothetical protein
MRKLFLAALFLAICPILVAQSLNNESVVKLVKAGLSEELIVSTINSQPGTFDTSVDGLIALKAAGVSDKVVAAIVTKASGAAAISNPGPDAPAQQTTKTADDSPGTAPEPLAAGSPEVGSATGSAPIHAGSRVVIAPMGGFETYFAAAVREKKVPITLTLDKASAQFYVVSTNTEWQGFVYGSGGGANWTPTGGSAHYGSAASSTRGLEASIMLIDAKTKDVVWAYEVHKNSHGALIFGTFGARGQQSIAESCAKHLKEYIEKGK